MKGGEDFMNYISIVRSSNGNIYIDSETGEVKHFDSFEDCVLPLISKFELPDKKAAEYDIIDLAYWLEDGTYEPIDEEILKTCDRDRKIEAVLRCLESQKIILVENIYDCECRTDYFRFFKSTEKITGKEIICEKCGMDYDNAPSSRLNELVAHLLKGA